MKLGSRNIRFITDLTDMPTNFCAESRQYDNCIFYAYSFFRDKNCNNSEFLLKPQFKNALVGYYSRYKLFILKELSDFISINAVFISNQQDIFGVTGNGLFHYERCRAGQWKIRMHFALTVN